MAGIFHFSSLTYPLGPLSRSEYSEIIGRVAHFVEYAGLAILLQRALSNNQREEGKKRKRRAEEQRISRRANANPSGPSDPSDSPDLSVTNNLSATTTSDQQPAIFAPFAFAFVYAILDELHQELTPGRGFELADIGYDLAGIIAALGLIRLGQKGKSGRKQ